MFIGFPDLSSLILLVFIGVYWCLLVFIGVYWCLLVFFTFLNFSQLYVFVVVFV